MWSNAWLTGVCSLCSVSLQPSTWFILMMTNHNQVVLVSKNKPDLYYRSVRTCKPSYKWILVNLEDAETSFKELYVLFGRANLPWMLLEAAGLDTTRWHLSKRKKETEETNRSWQVEYKYLKLKKKTHNKQSSASCHLLPHRRPLTGVLSSQPHLTGTNHLLR